MSEQLPKGFRHGLSGELYEEFGHYLRRVPVIDRTDPEHPVVIPPGDPLVKEVNIMAENGNNVAKMREALLKASDVLTEAVHHNLTEEYINECLTLIHAALAIPARNCDIGTPEEQWTRFERQCEAHRLPTDHDYCSCSCKVNGGCVNECAIIWAQMPYEENKMSKD